MEFPSSISVTWEDTTMKLFSLSLNEKQIWTNFVKSYITGAVLG